MVLIDRLANLNPEILLKRTKAFAVSIIRMSQNLPLSPEGRIIKNQLVKSATSVGANYRAACKARSGNEFYAKLSIVVEEADETLYWIELIEEANLAKPEELQKHKQEATELLKIFSSARKSTKTNLKSTNQ